MASHRSFARRVLLWIPSLGCAALIFYLSSQSDPMPGLTTLVWDKALHATEYGLLTVLLCRAWRGEGCGWLTASVLGLVVASMYALTDEWHQGFVAGRNSDLHDWLADSVGGFIGAAGYWIAGGRTWLHAAEREGTIS